MESNRRASLGPQLILGLCAIFFGILFTLDNLHILRFGDLWRFWPLILIVIGTIKILWAGGGSGLVAGGIIAGAGSLLLLNNLNFLRFSLFDYWPLVLVAIGVSVVWQALDSRRGLSTTGTETVSGFAFMSGVVRNCNTQNFRGGDLTAIMGGCEIDLRQASIADGSAVIQVLAFWGGIEIMVPAEWNVRSTVVPLLAGFEDKTRPLNPAGQKTLVVKGFAIMSGIEVHN